MNPYVTNSKIYHLYEQIKTIDQLKNLLIKKEYINRDNKLRTYVHSCTMLTKSYPFLIDYIREYLNLYPDRINFKNDNSYTALMVASSHLNTCTTNETIKVLLEFNPDVNAINKLDQPALNLAIMNHCSEETVEIFLNHKAYSYIRSSLMCAILNNSSNNIIKMLMDCNPDITAKNCHGDSIVSFTLFYAHEDKII